MRDPFSVTGPTEEESPLVVEIPHAGVFVDPRSLANISARASSIARDADLHVDALYADAPAHGAHLLVANVSRYVLDLNRAEEDIDPESVTGAPRDVQATRGLVWRLTSDGEDVLARPLARAELERRLDWLYRPYHARLSALIADKKRRFGFAIVLAAHSMPSVGRQGHGDQARRRADVVPGTRGRTSASARVIDVVDRVAEAQGLSVAHDDPYKGGFTTQRYGRPKDHVHVVQIEVARRLYMNEETLAIDPPRMTKLSRFTTALVKGLATAKP